MLYASRQGTDLKHCAVIVQGNTASGSMISGGYVFFGVMAMRMMLKLSIIIKEGHFYENQKNGTYSSGRNPFRRVLKAYGHKPVPAGPGHQRVAKAY